MGDLIGQSVSGELQYFPYAEFQRIRLLDIPIEEKGLLFADMCRLNALYMIARAGSGHIGSSFSSMEIFVYLFLKGMRQNLDGGFQDKFFSSKGHDAPGYYAVLMAIGKLDFDLIHKLRRIDGLPGHPDVKTPSVVANTGSLGMGVSKAKGMILANRQKKQDQFVYVLTGDGELQEGQFWESLISAANFGLHELVVIVDHNKLQSDTFVENVSDLGDLDAKLSAFGWCVARCDGNDINALESTFLAIQGDSRPKIIIADTVKGKGVSFMEHTSLDSDVALYRFHSGAPDAKAYQLAVMEITQRLQDRMGDLGLSPLSVKAVEPNSVAVPPTGPEVQRLIPAYGRALLEEAQQKETVLVLDADLVLDTGLIPFREQFPDRFVECGIAEQDMVSMAGGMALSGALPIVHSFSCFLSSRPNEQIYNNSTEGTKIIYVGSLAGVLPGGPGHSHQAVRDISSLGAVPGLHLLEPSCEAEVAALLHWAIHESETSSYIRLVSLPWEINYELPKAYQPTLGHGVTLLEGHDLAFIAAGPIMLTTAISAANRLRESTGLSAKVINLPWLNTVDPAWLKTALGGITRVVSLDNHYEIGGQGDALLRAFNKADLVNIKLLHFALQATPPSGTHAEVLNAVEMDVESLVNQINAKIA